MGLLLVPKLLAWIVLLTQRDNAETASAAAFAALAGILIETFLSGLIAPVMMIFQSLRGRRNPARTRRRLAGAAPRRRRGAAPRNDPQICAADAGRYSHGRQRLGGFVAAAAVDDPGDPRPVAGHSHRTAVIKSQVAAYRRPGLFATPEQTTPPRVLVRANELADADRENVAAPLQELRGNPDLLRTHLINLPVKSRHRGQIDPHLAIARAKIEDAESFEEAVGYLTPRETFAVLGSEAVLRAILKLPVARTM